MRLIRLTTDNKNADFKNIYFNDDIIINENSQIALKSVNFTLGKNDLIVTNTNQEYIFFSWSNQYYAVYGSSLTQFNISNGTYTEDNIENLLSNLTSRFNSMCSYDIDYANNYNNGFIESLGYQFKWYLTDDKYVKFEGKRSPYAKFNSVADIKDNISTPSYTARNGGTAGTLDSFMSSNKQVCSGYGVLRAKINTLNNVADPDSQSGFILGFTEEQFTNVSTINDIVYGVHIQKQNTDIKKIIDGVETGLGDNPTVNDMIELNISGGKINVILYTSTTYHTYELGDYNRNNKLYPVLCMLGSNTDARASLLRYTADPFLDTLYTFNDELTTETINPPQPVIVPTTSLLQFSSTELKEYLGFVDYTTKIQPFYTDIENDGDLIELLASDSYDFKGLDEGYLVILDNIKLDTFDSYKHDRQNIIEFINSSSNNDNYLNYNPNNLIFLDINNSNKETLRNINARILNSRYEKINVKHISEIVLLIK